MNNVSRHAFALSTLAFAPAKPTGPAPAKPEPTGVGAAVAEAQAETSGAADTGTALATAPAANFGGVGAALNLNGVAFKVKAQVTRSVIPQRDNETIYVKSLGKIYEGKALENGKTEMAPARLMEVANLATGQLALIIVNKVMEGQLSEIYPNDSYVNKAFALTMHPKTEGKRYKTFTIYELEIEPAPAA